MLPFLATDMFQLVFNLLERFVKDEALAEVTSTAKLVQPDLTKSSLHKTPQMLILCLLQTNFSKI